MYLLDLGRPQAGEAHPCILETEWAPLPAGNLHRRCSKLEETTPDRRIGSVRLERNKIRLVLCVRNDLRLIEQRRKSELVAN